MIDQPLDLDAIKQRAEAAGKELGRVCAEGPNRAFRMTIPANPDRDTDLIISVSLADTPALIAEVERLREALEAEGCLIESLSKAGADQAELWEEDRGHVERLRAALEEIASLSNDTKTGYADAIIFSRAVLEGVQRDTAE